MRQVNGVMCSPNYDNRDLIVDEDLPLLKNILLYLIGKIMKIFHHKHYW